MCTKKRGIKEKGKKKKKKKKYRRNNGCGLALGNSIFAPRKVHGFSEIHWILLTEINHALTEIPTCWEPAWPSGEALLGW